MIAIESINDTVLSRLASPSIIRLFRVVFPDPYMTMLVRELGNCTSVLDLGCGNSSLLSHLDKTRIYAVGLDAYKPYVIASKANRIHSEYALADLRKIPFRPKSFDCVVCLDVLEHLPKEDGFYLISEMENIAKKKGDNLHTKLIP